jgi:hypothetical protein
MTAVAGKKRGAKTTTIAKVSDSGDSEKETHILKSIAKDYVSK